MHTTPHLTHQELSESEKIDRTISVLKGCMVHWFTHFHMSYILTDEIYVAV